MNCSLSVSFEVLITAKLVLFNGFITFFCLLCGRHLVFFVNNGGNTHFICLTRKSI